MTFNDCQLNEPHKCFRLFTGFLKGPINTGTVLTLQPRTNNGAYKLEDGRMGVSSVAETHEYQKVTHQSYTSRT